MLRDFHKDSPPAQKSHGRNTARETISFNAHVSRTDLAPLPQIRGLDGLQALCKSLRFICFCKQAQVRPLLLSKERRVDPSSVEQLKDESNCQSKVTRSVDFRETMWCFKCFGNGEGSQEIDGMPRSKRWMKHGWKSSTSYTNITGDSYGGARLFAEISAKGEAQNGVSQASLRIVSVSGREFIPVILSPAAKASSFDTEIISISPMKTQKPIDPDTDLACTGQNARMINDQEILISGDKEDHGVSLKRGRRSWARVVKKKASGFLTASLYRLARNGKVRQDPNRSQTISANGSIYTDQTKPIELPIVGPEVNCSPSHRCSNIVPSSHMSSTRAAEGICKNFKLKSCRPVHGCRSAPTSPKRAVPSLLLPVDQSRAFQRSSSFGSNRGRVQSKGNIKHPRTKPGEGYDTALNLTGLLIILGCLVLSDRLCAIASTSLWWYLFPKLRNLSKSWGSQGSGRADSENIKEMMPSEPSTGSNTVDLHSSEYRKKVIMEGLLQRNRKV